MGRTTRAVPSHLGGSSLQTLAVPLGVSLPTAPPSWGWPVTASLPGLCAVFPHSAQAVCSCHHTSLHYFSCRGRSRIPPEKAPPSTP